MNPLKSLFTNVLGKTIFLLLKVLFMWIQMINFEVKLFRKINIKPPNN